MTVREYFGLGTAHVKALGALKKKEDDDCKMGQRQRADLSVFGRIKFFSRRNISV